ncbi:MAG: hypothetical protein HDT27_04770 [Subdoligranulum sp.]|nr:hypothetical protein [Subdoligranulum sp.]
MFYLKHNGKKLPIEEDNVFTNCPRCGKAFPVHLEDILHDGGDLYGTSVYCPECAARIEKKRQKKGDAQ